MPRFTSDQLAFAAAKMEATTASTACDLTAYAGVTVHNFDINDARQRRNDQDLMFGSMVNLANLALKAVRIYARRPELEAARGKGKGPDVLDIVSPVLVG